VRILKITDTHSGLATDTSTLVHPTFFRCKSDQASMEELHCRHERQHRFLQKLVNVVIYYTNDRLQGFRYITLLETRR
jgi:hypothetical protein